MTGKFTFLGSGTSRGVPMMCCDCEVCRSADPRDHHERSSGLVEVGDTKLLIDCGPDLRHQCLRFHVTQLDAVLLTHAHIDHLDGLDDLQGITNSSRTALPLYANAPTLALVHERYRYVDELKYQPDGTPRWSIPQLDYREATGAFSVAGVTVMPLPLLHGKAHTLGYRIGGLAYVCDCSAIPEETYPLLEGVTDLVVDALRWRRHPTHFSIFEAEAAVRRIRPRRAWFTHLCHDVLYARDQPLMQPGNTLAYDGLNFEFPV